MAGSPRQATYVVALSAVVSLCASASAQLVRCESIGGQRQTCAASTINGVQLAIQLGGSSCIAGKTWGWRPGAIWVEENCRGEFRVAYEERPGEIVVTCDSDHNRVQRCAVDTQYGLLMKPEDSSSNCVHGETWGWEIGSVWVSKRCEADFAVAPAELGRSVRCEALAGQRVECPVDNRGGVSLIAQHSTTPCVYSENWGLSTAGIWVDPPCGATFLVDARLRGSAYRKEPRALVCGAPSVERDFCPVDTSEGIQVAKSTGSAPCVENQSWGWTPQGIWISGGCQAEFVLQR